MPSEILHRYIRMFNAAYPSRFLRFPDIVMLARLSVPYVLFASIVVAVPTASAPAVKLDDATLTGKTSGNIQQFLGIPFAQPP
jgi:hypothetical protein